MTGSKDIMDFFEKETLKSTKSHDSIITGDLLNDFYAPNIDDAFNAILLNLACSWNVRNILQQQKASLLDPLWVFENKEPALQTISQSGEEIKISYPTGSSSSVSIFYFNSSIARDCYVECEFVNMEPGTMNCVFLTSSTTDFGAVKGYLAVQTAPSSRDVTGNIIGEGWTAIMEYDTTTTSHTPKVLAWTPDTETFGKFRLSKSATSLKLHRNNEFVRSAMSSFYLGSLYAGFFSYAFADEAPAFTIIKNLKCGNY